MDGSLTGSTGPETRLLRMLDEIRVGLNGKLEQIRQALELQNSLLADIKAQGKAAAPVVNVNAVDAVSIKPKDIAQAISRTVEQTQPQVKPQFPQGKKHNGR